MSIVRPADHQLEVASDSHGDTRKGVRLQGVAQMDSRVVSSKSLPLAIPSALTRYRRSPPRPADKEAGFLTESQLRKHFIYRLDCLVKMYLKPNAATARQYDVEKRRASPRRRKRSCPALGLDGLGSDSCCFRASTGNNSAVESVDAHGLVGTNRPGRPAPDSDGCHQRDRYASLKEELA
jgi:hypothetical protein